MTFLRKSVYLSSHFWTLPVYVGGDRVLNLLTFENLRCFRVRGRTFLCTEILPLWKLRILAD